ncbi:MAG: helix-turn-helix domain-containing protein [Bacteroidetes bacterium]|nr:helix-turn-helix domain-containing protein [Bacteroidota bacterium]
MEKKINNLEGFLITQKAVLTFDEAASYTGFSRSYLYKLTSTGKIPFFKPQGKMIFFDRIQLDNWLLRNQAESEAIDHAASTYVTINKRGGRQ